MESEELSLDDALMPGEAGNGKAAGQSPVTQAAATEDAAAGQSQPAAKRSRSRTLTYFFLRAVAAMILITALWAPAADYFSKPAAYVAGVVLENTVFLIKGFRLGPKQLWVETHIRLTKPGGIHSSGKRILHVYPFSVSLNPVYYCYSLPMLIALLLAGSRRKLIGKSLFGALALIPFQAFCIAMFVLLQLAASSDKEVIAATSYGYWETMAIAYGWQLGNGFIPTLSAIFLWAWLDRAYLKQELLG